MNKIPGSFVAPCRVAMQFTFNKLKEHILKCRLMHNLTIDESPNNSLNHRLVQECLLELHCGWYFPRLLHCIYALRCAGRSRSMLLGKIDVKSAYRRRTLRGTLAAISITTTDNYALLILCQTFGGVFGPCNFADIVSKPVTDLGNDLITCNE